jgi:hypothetical protein
VMARQRASSAQIIKKLGLKLTTAWPMI